MNKTYASTIILCMVFFFATATHAQPTTELIERLITASEKARQPDMQIHDVETYLAFLSEDLIDYHAAFNRTFSGKAHLRKGIVNKAASMVSISENIESIILGTDTAIVVVNEDSKYYKKGELKYFKGRTILVLEFNQQGLISQMRRYLD